MENSILFYFYTHIDLDPNLQKSPWNSWDGTQNFYLQVNFTGVHHQPWLEIRRISTLKGLSLWSVSTYSTALGSLSCREALTIIVVRAPAMCLSQDRCPKLRCALMSLLDQTSKEAFPTLSNSSPNRSPRRPWFTGRDYVRKMTIMFTHPTSKRKSQCQRRNWARPLSQTRQRKSWQQKPGQGIFSDFKATPEFHLLFSKDTGL